MSIRRPTLSLTIGIVAVLAYAIPARAACTVNAPTCTLSGGLPQVHVTWGGGCGGNAMERGAFPFGPAWDPLTHRTDFYPSQCGGFWCGPRDMGGATSFTDTDVVINDTTPYTYTYRIKIGPGNPSNNASFVVSTCACGGVCPPANDAQFISINAPISVGVGQTFVVQITMKNSGTTVWTAGTGFALMTTPANAALWQSVSSVPVTGSVAPNGTTTFTFIAKAPASSGTYLMGPWQMGQTGVGFGQFSPATAININQAADGMLETASCGALTGWAKDPDDVTPVQVRVYKDGPAGGGGILTATVTANLAHAAPYDGYGFSWTPPTDSTNHRYWLYAHDPNDGVWYQVNGTPSAMFACYPPPSATITTVTQPDYCTAGPAATVDWFYNDPPGLPQGQYQVQISTDPGFTALAYDSGIVPGTSMSAATGPGVLAIATNYWTRVKVWDTVGTPSAWSSSFTFTTPPGAYPQAAFTITPASPLAKQPATFDDTSNYNGAIPTARQWDFGDGSPMGSADPETHTYANAANNVVVTLRVASSVMPPGQFCTATKTINVQKPIPSIKEVRPGQ